MKVAAPIQVSLPASGLRFAESVHAREFHMAERADAFHKLIYVLAGEIDLLTPGRRPQPAAPGGLLLVGAGERHRLQDRVPATVLLMCFTDGWLARLPGLDPAWRRSLSRAGPARTVPAELRPRLEALWRRALFRQTRDDGYAPALTTATGVEILAELARLERLPEEPSAAERVRLVAHEIAATFVEPWTIERAASRAGLSRRSFTTHFRAELGTTFWEHLEELRVAHAAQLLQGGEHTLLGAMFSSGFNDVSTFYRAFKRRHGASPKKWLATTR